MKARLVVISYDQIYVVDCLKTFSLVAKIISVGLLISSAALYNWALRQLNVKNAFLHRTSEEEIYMKQSLGFVA